MGSQALILPEFCLHNQSSPSYTLQVVEFGKWLSGGVPKNVPHRHFVFSIPKIHRRYFLCNRSLFWELSRCAWETLRVFFRGAVSQGDTVPGATIGIQTFGDLLGFNTHGHVLCTGGNDLPR